MKSNQIGLTLLEMMVVLLIAGMAMALGFQSLNQWRRAEVAIASIQGATQETSLIESWLRSSLRSMVPIEERPFEGSADSLRGVSVSPVLSHQGGASDVVWAIDSGPAGSSLVLTEDENRLELAMPGAVSASFAYVDVTGKTYPQWPPKLGLFDHLPAAIVLQHVDQSGYKHLWAVQIAGALNPVILPFEAQND